MRNPSLICCAAIVLLTGWVGCINANTPVSTSGSGKGGTTSSGGKGGSAGSGGSAGKTTTSGSGGAAGSSTTKVGADASITQGGSTGSGATTPGLDSGAITGTGGSTVSPVDAPGEAASSGGGNVSLWLEAESTDNTLYNVKPAKCAKTCVGDPKEGDICCVGGGELTWIVGPQKSTVTFTKVEVPTAGDYDVTWWYHCGLCDHYHDSDCGGAPQPAWMTYFTPNAKTECGQPGCRAHLLTVNGKQLIGPNGEQYWQFPCFAGDWAIIHAATTTMTLNAGVNSIMLGAPHIGDEDAVDLDAIHVTTAGKGTLPKVVAPTAMAGDGRK